MRIGTWNTNFWKKRWCSLEKDQNDIDNWTIDCGHIIKEYNFDFLLLQETIPHYYSYFPEYNIYFNPIINERNNVPYYICDNGLKNYYNIKTNVFLQNASHNISQTRDYSQWWGNAIISKKIFEFKNYYTFRTSYSGSTGLMCYVFFNGINNICLINIYGKIDITDIENDYGYNMSYYNTTVHHMISDIEPLLYKLKDNTLFILGGDFNINENDDETVFKRIDRIGLKNYSKNMMTYYQDNGKIRQNDYIFSNRDFTNNCENIYDDKIKSISDHSMLILDI